LGGLDIAQVVALSLYVSVTATVLTSLVALPLGAFLAIKRFRGSWLLRTGVYTLFALPSVVVGLIVYSLLSRSGPLGFLDWIWTPIGMVIAESVLIFPLVTGLTMSSISDVDESVRLTIKTLGANNRQLMSRVMHEARFGIFGAVMVGFGRAISEVGAVWAVGGNIEGSTQVITTAIMQHTQMADYGTSFLLAGILLIIAFAVYFVIREIQERG
jgi:tungstate transport system permease protein